MFAFTNGSTCTATAWRSNDYHVRAEDQSILEDVPRSDQVGLSFSDSCAAFDLKSPSQDVDVAVEVRKGRPDFSALLAEFEAQNLQNLTRSCGLLDMDTSARKKMKMRVIACGPSPLVSAVELAAQRAKLPFVNGTFDMAGLYKLNAVDP
jgi:hypothetical protein